MDPKISFSSESSTFPKSQRSYCETATNRTFLLHLRNLQHHMTLRKAGWDVLSHIEKTKTIHINAIHLPFISLFPVSSIRGFPQEGGPIHLSES